MEELSRPPATRREVWSSQFAERIEQWVHWFGLARLLAGAVSVAIVCGGAYWLLRSEPPPTESSLPQVAAVGAPAITLPVPSTSAGGGSTPNTGAGRGDAGTTSSGSVTVHVAGAVVRPGVVELDAGARVHAAIAAAGGPVEDADVDALNLAAPVVDGSRLYVPVHGEDVPVTVAVAPAPSGGQAAPLGPVDVNRATELELQSLPGIGPATSAAIARERESNGPFLTVDDLTRVAGIGPATLEAIRDLVVV